MQPYAELLEFNQPNPIRKPGFTRIRDQFPELKSERWIQAGVDADEVMFYDAERSAEFAGRWDYGENNARKLGEKTKLKTVTLRNPETDEGYEYAEVSILQKYLAAGHESMIEMGDATFFIECSRAVGNELVRHRIASFQQESQRFSATDTSGDMSTYFIPDLDDDTAMAFDVAIQHSIKSYQELLDAGVPKQIARYVLPVGMRTRMVMKANTREWRHIMKLRTDKSVQPEMRALALQIYEQLVDVFPNAMSGVLDGERGNR